MKKLDFPIAATLLTFVLGSQIETSLLQSLTLSQNGFLIFFTRPVSGTIMAIAILILIISIISGIKNRRDMLSSDIEM